MYYYTIGYALIDTTGKNIKNPIPTFVFTAIQIAK